MASALCVGEGLNTLYGRSEIRNDRGDEAPEAKHAVKMSEGGNAPLKDSRSTDAGGGGGVIFTDAKLKWSPLVWWGAANRSKGAFRWNHCKCEFQKRNNDPLTFDPSPRPNRKTR